MADEIDIANQIVESELSWALKKIRENAAATSIGAKQCFECGDDIPAARQKLGFKFCVSCAEERERKKSLFAE